MISLKKISILPIIVLSISGCNLQDSADKSEYNNYNDNSDTTKTQVQLSNGGKILGAFVVDINDKVAISKGNGKYEFTGHIRYPIKAYGGWVDTNADNIIDSNDTFNNIEYRTNKGTNLTLLTTYMAGYPDVTNSDPRVDFKTEADMTTFTGLATADLYKLPSENVTVAAFNHAIYKQALLNYTTVGTELQNIATTDIQSDFNTLNNLYNTRLSNGDSTQLINQNEFDKLFSNNVILNLTNAYIFYPVSVIDPTLDYPLGTMPEIKVKFTNENGVLIDFKVSEDYANYINLYLETYGRLQEQIDILTNAYSKYAYATYNNAKALNLNSINEMDKITVFYDYLNEANSNYTIPNLSNNYNDPDILNWYNSYNSSLQNDNDKDFSINVTRYEWQKTIPFIESMLKNTIQGQYIYRKIHINQIKSRDMLVDLSASL